ncbi:hypothetical protein AAZX31_16G110200 [Glycine max]
MDANHEQIVVDVGSVVEAVSADDSHAPLYIIESLCMRCHENMGFELKLDDDRYVTEIKCRTFHCEYVLHASIYPYHIYIV